MGGKKGLVLVFSWRRRGKGVVDKWFLYFELMRVR